MNKLAVEQIEQLASKDGPIQLVETYERNGFTRFKVSLDTRGLRHEAGGILVRAREVFDIAVGSSFPFEPPSVFATHSRWAGTAHVQWGSSICVYAAPSVEWVPSDGMRGFLDRLSLWLEHAAAGTLDPEGQPLHPPVAYASATAGHLLVRAEVGNLAPWARAESARVLYAWCALDSSRVDVIEWLDFSDVAARVMHDDFRPFDDAGRPVFVAAATFISDQIAFEYPEKASVLVAALERSSVSKEQLLQALSGARLVNSFLESKLDGAEAFPNLVILGTPSRRVDSTLLAHISAWRLGDLGDKLANLLWKSKLGSLEATPEQILELASDWIGFADTAWMRVWEDRVEVTRPRDGGTTASAGLRGRRVLLLGAGALGGPIAEYCIRAGVSKLTIADQGRVGPGVLSRQPYADADISKPKAQVLAQRLSGIRLDLEVEHVLGDAKESVLSSAPGLNGFDLVIDATADVGVRTAIEARRTQDRENWPDILTVMIGHDARRGIAVFSGAGAAGGPVDSLRKFALDCLAEPALDDFADDFFPTTPRGDLFFPEPGCSSPTFIGSSADVTSLAGMLLNEGLRLAKSSEASTGAACVRRDDHVRPAVVSRTWPSDLIAEDASGSGYEIRISLRALDEMRAEARRGKRVRGRSIETGGMLLGAFDEAARTINIDRVAGPPPDSHLSATFFQHGTIGTQEIVDDRLSMTDHRQGFVGLWHTHPYGVASPSTTDDEGMWQLVHLDRVGRRALMVILGGEEWEQWLKDGTPPSMYARISTLAKAETVAEQPLRIIGRGVTGSFPGGYAYPRAFHSNPERSAR